MSKCKHPSGRPIREQDRRAWQCGSGYGAGYRLPHLRRLHGDDGGGTVHAVGFTAQFPPELEEIYTWGRRK